MYFRQLHQILQLKVITNIKFSFHNCRVNFRWQKILYDLGSFSKLLFQCSTFVNIFSIYIFPNDVNFSYYVEFGCREADDPVKIESWDKITQITCTLTRKSVWLFDFIWSKIDIFGVVHKKGKTITIFWSIASDNVLPYIFNYSFWNWDESPFLSILLIVDWLIIRQFFLTLIGLKVQSRWCWARWSWATQTYLVLQLGHICFAIAF